MKKFDITVGFDLVAKSPFDNTKEVHRGTRTYTVVANDRFEAMSKLSDHLNKEIDLVCVCEVKGERKDETIIS